MYDGIEAVNNPYLGGDTTLMVSDETAQIDEEVLSIIKTCYQNAIDILKKIRTSSTAG